MSILVLQSSRWEREAGCFALFVFLVLRDCCVALYHDAMGLSAVCACDISWLYSLTIFYTKEHTPLTLVRLGGCLD